MNDAAKTAAKHAAQRIQALRTEIRETEQSLTPGRGAMLKALRRDLLEQEVRLHDSIVAGSL